MNNDINNPFNWRMRTRPSIFANDPAFRAKADGKTDNQRATETVQRRRDQGVDPVKLYGIGKPTKEKEERLLAYKQFGTYSKAVPSKRQPNKHEK